MCTMISLSLSRIKIKLTIHNVSGSTLLIPKALDIYCYLLVLVIYRTSALKRLYILLLRHFYLC